VLGWQDAAVMWAAADIALSTSENEGMPVALIEAQLAGLPVVATDVGAVSEVVIDGVTGFVTAREVRALKERLSELLEDSSLRQRMGAAAKTHAEALFTPERMLSQNVQLYERLVNEPKRR
jgi:glycosyltransferase involved in cell wall biosynthesis